MQFETYNPVPGSGCVPRTFSKLLDMDVASVIREIESLAMEMGYPRINDVEVFEKYFQNHHYEKKEKKGLVKDLSLLKGKYGVFCSHEDDYHMFAVINGVIYDKNQNYGDYQTKAIYQYQK